MLHQNLKCHPLLQISKYHLRHLRGFEERPHIFAHFIPFLLDEGDSQPLLNAGAISMTHELGLFKSRRQPKKKRNAATVVGRDQGPTARQQRGGAFAFCMSMAEIGAWLGATSLFVFLEGRALGLVGVFLYCVGLPVFSALS